MWLIMYWQHVIGNTLLLPNITIILSLILLLTIVCMELYCRYSFIHKILMLEECSISLLNIIYFVKIMMMTVMYKRFKWEHQICQWWLLMTEIQQEYLELMHEHLPKTTKIWKPTNIDIYYIIYILIYLCKSLIYWLSILDLF